MSVFPKNILVKIMREAVTSEHISVCDARLVCKAMKDDFKINFYFEQLKDLMRKWNIMRDAVRRKTYIDVVQNSLELRVPMLGFSISNASTIIIDDFYMGESAPIFVMSYSHKTEEYVIQRPMGGGFAYNITEVFPQKRQKTSHNE
jgi:hypothetical protein